MILSGKNGPVNSVVVAGVFSGMVRTEIYAAVWRLRTEAGGYVTSGSRFCKWE